MDKENEFENRVSRRKFFNIAGWTGLCAFLGSSSAAGARYFYPKVLYEPASTFNAGKPEEYTAPTGNEVIVVDERWKKNQRVWIARNKEGIYAVVAVCTHLGCTPNWFPAEVRFKCPCHGSGFTKEGVNYEGPAPRPLERLKIGLAEDGQIVIDSSVVFRRERGEWEKPGAFLRA